MIRGILCCLCLVLLPCSSRGAGGQWIAVVAPGLREALKPLAEQRRADGWTVTVLAADRDMEVTRKQIVELAGKTGPVCVLLAGDFAPDAAGTGVPAGRGTQLRMAGILSDAPWNLLQSDPGRVVETGRLPARDAAEAGVMVRKILAWPAQSAAAGPFPLAKLMAGHHGAPAAFSGMADSLTNTLAQRLISRLPPAWELEAAVHVDGSPWQISGSDLGPVTNGMLRSPATLLAYMGHSSPETPVSKGTALLGVDAWRAMTSGPPRTGLFFSCGCYTTELNPQVESFGFAAMRAPAGPPAVIGSHGETYAAFGYLAMCGLVDTLSQDPPPSRLGQIWHGVREGLANHEISAAEFAMLDLSDGTGGRVPLEAQRLEHLESWMLLGDPAMPLLPAAPAIRLTVPGRPEAGETLTVSGEMPDKTRETALRVTFERRPGTVRADLPQVPTDGADRAAAARERRKMSEHVVLASVETTARNGRFTATLTLPDDLPAGPWTVRATPLRIPGPAGVLELPDA